MQVVDRYVQALAGGLEKLSQLGCGPLGRLAAVGQKRDRDGGLGHWASLFEGRARSLGRAASSFLA